LSRLFPLGEIHLWQTRTVAADSGVVVGSPQATKPICVQAATSVESATKQIATKQATRE